MTEENLNKFIDKSFEENLFSSVKPDFAENVMRQVELSKRFQAEDKKTFRVVNFMSVFLALFITSAGVFLAYLISKSGRESADSESYIPGTADAIEKWVVKLFSLMGLTLSESTIIYILLVVVILILFLVIDRYFSGSSPVMKNGSGKI
ncbi:MAG: hypothetical protein MUE56_04655 [Ignavibacteria bacterium]|jgi:hypothetical protein|nr:hypothetical protein [Ignavibacteria bacterium]